MNKAKFTKNVVIVLVFCCLKFFQKYFIKNKIIDNKKYRKFFFINFIHIYVSMRLKKGFYKKIKNNLLCYLYE